MAYAVPIAIVLMAAATAASAYASYQSGKMQQKAAETSAELAERDAANQRAAEVAGEHLRPDGGRTEDAGRDG